MSLASVLVVNRKQFFGLFVLLFKESDLEQPRTIPCDHSSLVRVKVRGLQVLMSFRLH